MYIIGWFCGQLQVVTKYKVQHTKRKWEDHLLSRILVETVAF